MSEPGPVTTDEQGASRPAFVSYATADRKQALSLCAAIERRGAKCWISARDVAPGENYQEAIVRSLRSARAMVLVFSHSANQSDEIKKELSLASRYRVPVIAFRIEDVEPSDAFAYELSTRQWIDAFEGRDKAIDSLVGRISEISAHGSEVGEPSPRTARRQSLSRRGMLVAGSGLVLLLAALAGWFWLRPSPAPAHAMTVRLAEFQLLSPGLPPTIRDAVDAEIVAAFNADGVVGVSTASAPPPGSDPAYALGGTIQQDGEAIRVITRLTNERSGATVWSGNFDYNGKEVAKVPRHIAVDAGNVVRCGLFGASTYHKALPDNVLKDYMQFCQGYWDPNMEEGRKALVPAQRVVAAVPDFSWGWAAVAGSYWKVAMTADDEAIADDARAKGREAADRASAIDGRNSEALYIKSMLIGRHDWIGREALFKRAVGAQRLDCGCEHHQYGEMLLDVGRVTEAVEQLRQANNTLALYVYTPLSLANALVAAGKPEEAKTYFDAAAALAPTARFAARIAVSEAIETGDITALSNRKLTISDDLRGALLDGFHAAGSRDSAAKANAVRRLLALPDNEQSVAVMKLLADLGAGQDAFRLAVKLGSQDYPGPSVFWSPNMRGTLNDPGFPTAVSKLGLIRYWKVTHTKPDVCKSASQPAFCRMI